MMDDRLSQHCAALNEMKWVIASGDPYIVWWNADSERHDIIRRSEMPKERDKRA